MRISVLTSVFFGKVCLRNLHKLDRPLHYCVLLDRNRLIWGQIGQLIVFCKDFLRVRWNIFMKKICKMSLVIVPDMYLLWEQPQDLRVDMQVFVLCSVVPVRGSTLGHLFWGLDRLRWFVGLEWGRRIRSRWVRIIEYLRVCRACANFSLPKHGHPTDYLLLFGW